MINKNKPPSLTSSPTWIPKSKPWNSACPKHANSSRAWCRSCWQAVLGWSNPIQSTEELELSWVPLTAPNHPFRTSSETFVQERFNFRISNVVGLGRWSYSGSVGEYCPFFSAGATAAETGGEVKFKPDQSKVWKKLRPKRKAWATHSWWSATPDNLTQARFSRNP